MARAWTQFTPTMPAHEMATPTMAGSTSDAVMPVIGIPMTKETIASAVCRFAAALLGGLLAVGELGVLPQLCGSGGREILYPFRKARGDVFGVFRPSSIRAANAASVSRRNSSLGCAARGR